MIVQPEIKTRPATDVRAALTYIPVILGRLDADTTQMFGTVLQAAIEAGYFNGYEDGKQTAAAKRGYK